MNQEKTFKIDEDGNNTLIFSQEKTEKTLDIEFIIIII